MGRIEKLISELKGSEKEKDALTEKIRELTISAPLFPPLSDYRSIDKNAGIGTFVTRRDQVGIGGIYDPGITRVVDLSDQSSIYNSQYCSLCGLSFTQPGIITQGPPVCPSCSLKQT